MKVLVTGGHFSPAYSVIKELTLDNHKICVAGRVHPFEGDKTTVSYEYTVSKELGIPFYELKTGRLQRNLTKHTIPSLGRIPLGVVDAYLILSRTNPDVVLTFGGYLGLPIAAAARMRGIPVVAHEQTQRLGLANSWIAKFAQVVCVSFPESQQVIKHKHVILTGNPLRKEIFEVNEKVTIPEGLPVIYITGGSTGSHAINEVLKDAAAQLLEKYVLIHQTGDSEFKDYDVLQQIRDTLPPVYKSRYILRKFILPAEIGYIYKKATAVVGRSGANTVLELIALEKPSILVPLPYGQHGEQHQNAELVEKLGLGQVLVQENMNRHSLIAAIDSVIGNSQKYTIPAHVKKKYIFPDAARRIVDVLIAQYEKKKKRA